MDNLNTRPPWWPRRHPILDPELGLSVMMHLITELAKSQIMILDMLRRNRKIMWFLTVVWAVSGVANFIAASSAVVAIYTHIVAVLAGH